MNKAPSFQQYPDKWLADTRLLSFAAKGIYADLLNIIWMQYQDTCSIPDHADHVSREIGCTVEEWLAARAEIMNEHRPLMRLTENQRLFSNGLWKEHEKQRLRREHLAANGRLGGRPRKQKVILGKPDVKPGTGKADESLSSPTSSPAPSPNQIQKEEEGSASQDSTMLSALAVARKLATSIHGWKPNFAEVQPSKINRTINRWAKDIAIAIRTDNRTTAELEAVVAWLPTHEGKDGFRWRDQILSGRTLREKFDRLEIAMRNGGSNGERRVAGRKLYTAEEVGAHMEEISR